MTIVAVIPVKRLANAKRRLAARLSPSERAGIVLRCLETELSVLGSTSAVCESIVVTSDSQVAAVAEMHSATTLLQLDNGINAAVRSGVTHARTRGATEVLILHGDLPFLTTGDVEEVVRASLEADVIIAPDRHGTGTNALLIPARSCFKPAYGNGSYPRHLRNAREGGLRVKSVHAPGLAFDLDTPVDLQEYRRRVAHMAAKQRHEGRT